MYLCVVFNSYQVFIMHIHSGNGEAGLGELQNVYKTTALSNIISGSRISCSCFLCVSSSMDNIYGCLELRSGCTLLVNFQRSCIVLCVSSLSPNPRVFEHGSSVLEKNSLGDTVSLSPPGKTFVLIPSNGVCVSLFITPSSNVC